MGASQSSGTPGGGAEASVAGMGVASLMRGIGMAMIPAHLRHTLDSITQIIDTATKLRAFDEAPYTGNMMMLAALVRHAQMEDTGTGSSSGNTEAERVPSSDPAALSCFEEDKRFGTFATNIYFASLQLTKSQIASNMGVSQEDVLFSYLTDEDEEHCPKFMIILDHDTASIVLVIRGTFSIKDVVMDVVCEDAEFLDGFAHSGFLNGSRMLLSKCSSVLERALCDNFGYGLVVCGHSMGGSVSIMVTMTLLSSSSSLLPPGVGVRCVALGPAPVFRIPGARGVITDDDYRDKVHIFINDKDVVPRLSLGSVAQLLRVLRELDGLGLSLDQQLAVIMWRRDEDTETNRARVRDIVNTGSQDRFPFLYHPGSVFWLRSSVSPGARARVTVSRVTEEEAEITAESLGISETMVSDHIHTAYRENFGRVQS